MARSGRSCLAGLLKPRLVLVLATLGLCAAAMASPISGLDCNLATSPAYPCIVEITIATDGSELAEALLDVENPYFWDYIENTAFGHCSWIGGIVHRCAEPRVTSSRPAYVGGGGTEPPGGGVIPGDEEEPPAATPEPATGAMMLGAILWAAAIMRRGRRPSMNAAPRST